MRGQLDELAWSFGSHNNAIPSVEADDCRD